FSLPGSILHPTQQVRFLRSFSRLEFLCADHLSVPRHVLGVLSASPNAVSRTCRSTCDVGSRKSRFAKTNYRFSGNLRFVCGGCPGLSFALGRSQTESGSIAELGSSPLSHPPPPIGRVYRATTFHRERWASRWTRLFRY